MTETRLRVHICSRDRTEALRRLLDDLAVVLDGLGATVTVYDDSTSEPCRRAYRTVARRGDLQVSYFGERERLELLARARRALRGAEECLAASRPLGTGTWDLAGVRFTAMLAAALDRSPETLHLFLDDDMRLVGCDYANARFDVDVDSARRALRSELPADELVAAGPALRGRADLSTLEHVDSAFEGLAAGETLAEVLYPAVVSPNEYVHPESPGVSGGVLLTNRHSLRSVLLSRSYDEDWIWLRELRLHGGAVRRLDWTVVHAGGVHVEPSAGGLAFQFDGEVLDAALRLCEEADGDTAAWAGFSEDALGICTERLVAVAGRADEVAGLFPDHPQWPRLASDAALLGRAGHAAEALRPAPYQAVVEAHRRRSDRWESAFARVQ